MKIRLSTGTAVVTGIAKGSGMIRPDMATMLGFVATDAAVSRKHLQKVAKAAADRSFNCVTVDGDTSTNDAFVLVATGQGPAAASSSDQARLEEAVTEVSRQLAQAIHDVSHRAQRAHCGRTGGPDRPKRYHACPGGVQQP